MAESSLAVEITNTFADDAVNKPSEVNTNFTELASGINAIVETATGHSHDGTDSKLLSGSSFTMADMMMMIVGGGIA